MQVPRDHDYLDLSGTVDLDEFRDLAREPRVEADSIAIRLMNNSEAVRSMEAIIMRTMGARLPDKWKSYDTSANLAELYRNKLYTKASDIIVATLCIPPNTSDPSEDDDPKEIPVDLIDGLFHISPAVGANRIKALEVNSRYSIRPIPKSKRSKKPQPPTPRIFVQPKLGSGKVVANPFLTAAETTGLISGKGISIPNGKRVVGGPESRSASMRDDLSSI